MQKVSNNPIYQEFSENEINMWQSIKGGTFVDDYRSALQKAIDKNASVIHVQRKKEIEKGDLQMFDGTGWVPFCIHKAESLIKNEDFYIAVREFNGIGWINRDSKKLNDSFAPKQKKNWPQSFLDFCNKDDWYRMARQDRETVYGD